MVIMFADGFEAYGVEGLAKLEGLSMGIKLKPKQAEAVETKTITESGQVISEDTETKQVEVPEEIQTSNVNATPGCEVGVDMSYTENLGNYRSARVGVSLKVTVAHEDIDEAFDYAKAWVDQRMETMVGEVQELKNA